MFEGTFHNGVIVPDDATAISAAFAEGERVNITPVVPTEPSRHTFAERYAAFKGCLPDDVPEDLSTQHEHYRLGTPKR